MLCVCVWVGVGLGAQGMQGRVAINSLLLSTKKSRVIAQEVILFDTL